MVLLSSLASSLPPALRPRGLHGSRGMWAFPLLDGLPTSATGARFGTHCAIRGNQAGMVGMAGPDGIRLGGLIGAGSFGQVFEGKPEWVGEGRLRLEVLHVRPQDALRLPCPCRGRASACTVPASCTCLGRSSRIALWPCTPAIVIRCPLPSAPPAPSALHVQACGAAAMWR